MAQPADDLFAFDPQPEPVKPEPPQPVAVKPPEAPPAPAPAPHPAPTAGSSGAYSASSIEVLEGLEPVRKRPCMYIGGTRERALLHRFA